MAVMLTEDVSGAYEAASSGMTVILVRTAAGDLPAGTGEAINRQKDGSVTRFDMLPKELCYSHASRLSAIWSVTRTDDAIPGSAAFGRLFDNKTDKDVIIKNYKNNDITKRFAAPIGLGAGSKKVFLDLHEKAAGPHGLIAGTTGSGKSELLTTIILSFAFCYPPDKLAFFLIDYKGGGMSNLFASLPHLIGSISNLSRVESQRAMTSLRQELFAGSGVNNINDYTHLYDQGRVFEPVPHVLIIVDEFAELKKEEPEFMDRLISISQTGRSLGMHLILATQKPSGVVDDRIRSNTGFRIALRLVDSADSADMLHRPDAVTLKERGRAFLQVGNDDIF